MLPSSGSNGNNSRGGSTSAICASTPKIKYTGKIVTSLRKGIPVMVDKVLLSNLAE